MPYAVITGASRGIGRATALELGRRGCKLALLGRESKAQEETLQALADLGTAVEFLPCDLSLPAQVKDAAGAVLQGGAPDTVIHNAGVLARASVEELSLQTWSTLIAVNLTAPFLLTQALLPAMKARRTGRLVFVSSLSATLGTRLGSGYNATKWGLNGFVKSLAEELSDTGLSATLLLPGAVKTDMLELTPFAARMTAEEVAKTLAFLALDAPLAHNGGVFEMFGV
jgi:NAD(P)-dependent dehydrogenase (short-subunit alcohol dehydrogenase family)